MTAGKFDKEAAQHARDDLEEQKVKDTVDRYRFLLGQSDLFAHFITSKGLLASDDSMNVDKKAAAGKKGKANSKRGRKTEKEEDEELLQEELNEEDAVDAPLNTETVFSESPAFVTGGKLREYQIQGVNWMISLFEHGISGILADEMGLVCFYVLKIACF
eukprot:Partr_v1_DN28893_c0_g1_i2_m34219 putative SWI SNF related, matrix associated, actin dependent regulator of chromatin, subfamily a, member